jgi:hypothetical protein
LTHQIQLDPGAIFASVAFHSNGHTGGVLVIVAMGSFEAVELAPAVATVSGDVKVADDDAVGREERRRQQGSKARKEVSRKPRGECIALIQV